MTLQGTTAVVGGAVHDAPQGVTVTAPVVFDSRRVEAGGMFVALPGERVDGHDYAAQAIEAGVTGSAAARRGISAAVATAMTTTYRAASSMGTPTRRAPISSGRVAPGRRLGRRSDRVNTNTAASREAHGPAVPQLRHLPSALDTACRSSATCAASTCSPPGYMAILNRPSRWWSYALRAEDRALSGLAQRADRLPAWTEQRKAGAAAP